MFENLLALGFAATFITLLFGLSVGSFLNVVIHRLPIMNAARWRDDALDMLALRPPERAGYNLAWPRSQCPSCRAPIAMGFNIPLVSFLVLRGACRSCAAPIPRRYPAVEAIVGIIAVACVARWGIGLSTFCYFAFFVALLGVLFIDWDTGFIPDEIVLPLMWLGLLQSAWLASSTLRVEDAIAGAIAGYLVLWSIFWIFKLITGRDGMGYGDFKLLAAIGAWVGWQVLPTVVLVAALSGLAYAAIRYARSGETGSLPFGPFLALGGATGLIQLTG